MNTKTEFSDFRNIYIIIISVICVISCLLFSLFFLVGNSESPLNSLFASKPAETTPVTSVPETGDEAKATELRAEIDKYTQIIASPYLKVVNSSLPLAADYVSPTLSELSSNPSMQLEQSAALQIEKFFADAEAAGFKYIVTAAYRTAAAQTEAYNSALQENLKAGYTTEQAETLASKTVAKTGESEYQTGLLIAFSESRAMTAEDFKATEFFKYIKENIYKYGFVLRYPETKEGITGYDASPFIYRYVGSIESATYITENNLTLEEYNDYVGLKKLYAEQALNALTITNG